MSDLWDPLLLSLRIAGAAVIVGALIAVPLAYLMSRRRFAGKSMLEALIIVPMVLPPTVVGYILIMLMGRQGWFGQWLDRAFHYSIMFSFEGAVLAAVVVSMPMLYLPAKAGFASVEREMEDSARLLGADRLRVFWHVSLPLARRGIYAGVALAFARALGEFGATIMVFGWQPNHMTLPISIYEDYESGQNGHALAAVLALIVISVALAFAFNRSAAGRQE